MQPFQNLRQSAQMSSEAAASIISRFGREAFSSIAATSGVCVETVAGMAEDFAAEVKAGQTERTYRFLSMDEVFVSRPHGEALYLWVLNNSSNPLYCDNIRIEYGRKKEEVISRLNELKHPEAVEAVSIDMWAPYKDAVGQVLPGAAVVAGRFHAVKQAEDAMDKARKSAKVDKETKSAMEEDADLFIKSFNRLTLEELGRLEGYLKKDEELENTCFVVQDLMEFYRKPGYEEALDYLCQWETEVLKANVEALNTLHNTVYNWLPYIMNYFNFRTANGRTEGKNHLIRTIGAIGLHYGLASLQGCLCAHDRTGQLKKFRVRLKGSPAESLQY
jgi:transposase